MSVVRLLHGGSDAPARQRWLWVAGAAVLLLTVTVQPLRDTDVWWHLALGRFIVSRGIPAQEPFSFLAAGHPWVGQQWLYEVLLAGLVGAGGYALASVVMGVVAAAALLVAALAVPRATHVPGPLTAGAMLLSGLVMAQVIGVRGQVFSLLGLAIVLLVLSRWREGRTTTVWVLPPVFLLWANLHAGFIIGIAVLIAGMLLARPVAGAPPLKRLHLLAAIGVSSLATLANPAGPGLYAYVAETFANPTLTQLVTEWMSPDFHNIWLRLFEVEALGLVVVWAAGGGPDRLDLVLALGALAATLQAQRNVSVFAIIALPQLAVYGARAWHVRIAPRVTARGPRLPSAHATLLGGTALAAVTIAVATTIVPGLTPAATARFVATRYPEAAADFVAARFPGERLYSEDTWGGYLAYRFPSDRVVFLYDETAIFGDAALQRYLQIHLLRPGWSGALEALGVSHAVLSDTSQEASAFHEIGWTVDCHDAASSSLVMSAPSGPVLAVARPLPSSWAGIPRC